MKKEYENLRNLLESKFGLGEPLSGTMFQDHLTQMAEFQFVISEDVYDFSEYVSKSDGELGDNWCIVCIKFNWTVVHINLRKLVKEER